MFPKPLLAPICLCLPALVVAACNQRDEVAEAVPAAESADVLGDVSFEVSCDEAVHGEFDRAVATLHSFEFEEARGMFESIAAQDPECAMAHWGVAMTSYHPLWAPPTESERAQAAAAIETAQGLNATEREKLYIEAIASFFRDAESVGHRERAMRYENGMADVHAQYPDDAEAKIFYALAVLSNADPTDKAYAVQKRSGGMLEPMFVEMPNHPGLAHYIIHSYDYPPLAERAVDAAHRYLEIAQSLPHALHMSGHIFTQLGMWEDSIVANTRSAEAAVERGERFGRWDQAQMNELHALDYLVYAYLQRGEDDKARKIVDDVSSRSGINWENGIVALNAGAIPVRWALERGEWMEAASLPPLEGAENAGNSSGTRGSVALRYWARALGAARSGQIEQAEAELAELTRVASDLQNHDQVGARNRGEVLRREAAAWLALANGDEDGAETLMRSAAELEDETDKSGVSPGRVLPAHEQLADMLMEVGRPQEALAEYQTSLTHATRRYNSFIGAARAAVAAEQNDVARSYYEKLLQLAASDSPRADLDEARGFLDVAS